MDGEPSERLYMKQIIMDIFPPFNSDDEVTEKNIEAMTLRRAKLFNDYFEKHKSSDASITF